MSKLGLQLDDSLCVCVCIVVVVHLSAAVGNILDDSAESEPGRLLRLWEGNMKNNELKDTNEVCRAEENCSVGGNS